MNLGGTNEDAKTPKGAEDGISFDEYRSRLLALEEHQNDNMQEAVLQNSNFMSLVITFIFLFEMDFVAGVFPSAVSDIEYARYSCCLSILMCANGFLVLALALLLKVTECVRLPNLQWEYHFGYVSESTDERRLAEREKEVRYGINVVTRTHLDAANRVVFIARRYTLIGMMVGVLSAIMFVVNGRVLNGVLGGLQGDGALWPGARIWTGLGFGSLIVCIVLYYLSSREIRGLASGSKSGSSALFMEQEDKYFRTALNIEDEAENTPKKAGGTQA